MTILESRHGKGTFVSSLDPGLLSEPINFILQADTSVIASLFEVRRMVEVDAAGLAAERITPEALEALETLVEKAEQVIGDEQAFVRYDFEIHEAITHAVRNPILNSICAGIAHLSLESRQRTAVKQETRRRAHEDHLAIVQALRNRDAEAATTAMRGHLAEVEKALGPSDG